MIPALAGIIGGAILFPFCSPAPAVEIIIDQGVEKKLPIAVIPFIRDDTPLPRLNGDPLPDPARIIMDDLHYSGLHEILPLSDLPGNPSDPEDARFSDWRRIGVEHLLIGRLIRGGDGRYKINYHLLDVYKETRLISASLPFPLQGWRRAAHHISDRIFLSTTGLNGVFSNRIVFTARDDTGNTHTIRVADYDGQDQRVLLTSPHPLLSPAVSPDGQKLAYVSFEGGGTSVYVQHLASGERQRVAAWPGINSAPSFSPDGKRLGVTLSKDGNPEIYILYLETALWQRVTDHPAIDTEPAWSPDGKRLYFTSDRSGRPQIYEANLHDGNVRRFTFEGEYNAKAALAPDGQQLGVVHHDGSGFRIGVYDLPSGVFRVIGGRMVESLSFAPNNWLLLYSSEDGIATLPVNGSVERPLAMPPGLRAREAVWLIDPRYQDQAGTR